MKAMERLFEGCMDRQTFESLHALLGEDLDVAMDLVPSVEPAEEPGHFVIGQQRATLYTCTCPQFIQDKALFCPHQTALRLSRVLHTKSKP